MFKCSIKLLCGLMFLSCAASSEKRNFWTNPSEDHQKFLEQLDDLPKYVESADAEEALKSLKKVMKKWDDEERGESLMEYSKGYGKAQDKIISIFDSYLRNQNENATKLMVRNLHRHYCFQNTVFEILQNSEHFKKANILWLMKIMPDDNYIEDHMIWSGIMNLNGVLKYMPLDIRSANINFFSRRAKQYSRAKVDSYEGRKHKVFCEIVKEMKNYNEPVDSEFEKFLIEREICMAENAAEGRRQIRLQAKVERVQSEAPIATEPAH